MKQTHVSNVSGRSAVHIWNWKEAMKSFWEYVRHEENIWLFIFWIFRKVRIIHDAYTYLVIYLLQRSGVCQGIVVGRLKSAQSPDTDAISRHLNDVTGNKKMYVLREQEVLIAWTPGHAPEISISVCVGADWTAGRSPEVPMYHGVGSRGIWTKIFLKFLIILSKVSSDVEVAFPCFHFFPGDDDRMPQTAGAGIFP